MAPKQSEFAQFVILNGHQNTPCDFQSPQTKTADKFSLISYNQEAPKEKYQVTMPF